jgi:hypothetical protein
MPRVRFIIPGPRLLVASSFRSREGPLSTSNFQPAFGCVFARPVLFVAAERGRIRDARPRQYSQAQLISARDYMHR